MERRSVWPVCWKKSAFFVGLLVGVSKFLAKVYRQVFAMTNYQGRRGVESPP